MGGNRLLSKKHAQILEDALFKCEVLGIKQYHTDGVFFSGIKIDLEYELFIVEGRISLTRNRYTIYNETVEKFKRDYIETKNGVNLV